MTAAQPAIKELDLTKDVEDDLFDAVLTGLVDKERSLPSKQIKAEVKTEDDEKPAPPPETPYNIIPTTKNKKLGVYIGKFPWWITQEDVTQLLHKVGVQDIIEIKFAENIVNGLSKGYVKVVVHSMSSVMRLLDRIKNHTLGGEVITCRYAKNSNLSLFKDMSEQSLTPRDASINCNEPGFSQNPMPEQFCNQFSYAFPSIPNQFLTYPAAPFLPMPPPPLLPMHLNFMNSASVPQLQNHQSVSAIASTSQDGQNSSSHSDEKSDKEFEDVINRNRAVASAAINKAVSGATTGDLRVAMETLLTAISIIKHSRAYQDDRCQALVTSLKDCLMSIQGNRGSSRHEENECRRRKSSSSERRRSSRRDRDRSQSRERSGGHSKERSGDWDRHRDRDRNRYY